jgi:integrase
MKRQKHYLDESEVELLASQIAAPYDLLVYVLAYGGLRWAEAVGLRRSDCELMRGRLSITETLSEVAGVLHRGPTKTYENRSVALPAFVRDALVEHLAENVEPHRDALVFTGPEGGPLRSSNFRKRVWLPAIEALGGQIPLDFTPHHLRHTCASLLVRSGAHAKAIQAHLGHSSITVTMDVYGHLFPDDMDALASRLDKARRDARAVARPQGNVRRLTRE